MIRIILAVIGVLLCCGSFFYNFISWYLNLYYILLRSKCFRGPLAFPLIGSAYMCTGNTADIFKRLQTLIEKYQSPFRLWLGPQLFFVVHEPEQIKLILTNPNARDKGPVNDALKSWLGEGLFTSTGMKWKIHRKIMNPSFTAKALEPLTEVFTRKALLMTEKMWAEEQEREFDVSKYTLRYTFDSICETTVGVHSNSLTKKECTYLDTLESMMEITATRTMKPWLRSDIVFNCTSIGRKYRQGLQFMQEFTRDILRSADNEAQDGIDMQIKRSVVSLLRSSTGDSYKFSDKDICDEIATITAAGSETTSNLLCYTMFILANYPDIQNKVYEEVRGICGQCSSEGMEISVTDLNRMEYLDRVLKETQRFFPASTIMGRHLSRELNLGEYTLPAGSSVLIGFFNIHRSEENWLKPLEFIPDRFLPMHPLGPRHPYAYIPFSAGARACIGMRYATMSAKTLIAILVLKYVIKTSRKFREAKDMEVKMNVTLKPKEPIILSIERRSVESS